MNMWMPFLPSINSLPLPTTSSWKTFLTSLIKSNSPIIRSHSTVYFFIAQDSFSFTFVCLLMPSFPLNGGEYHFW